MAQARKVRRKPAASTASAPAQPTPGWVWLLAGLIVGLAVAGVFFLQGVDRMGQDASWLRQESAPTAPPLVADPPAPPQPARDTARFQFYELLPQDEIRVPAPSAATPATPAAPPPTATPTQPAAPAAARVALQTGSFRQAAQADEMRARLALLGLQANVRVVRVNGETFHRVFVGPFESDAQVNRALERLQRESIDAFRVPASG